MTITPFIFQVMGPCSIIGWLWFIVGLGFLAFELSTPGLFFFVAFAIGSFGAGIAAFLAQSLSIQCLSGLVLGIVSFYMLRKLCVFQDARMMAKTNSDALIGKKGVVIREMSFERRGQIKIGGEIWSARSQHEEAFTKQATVSVVGIQGNTLIVSK